MTLLSTVRCHVYITFSQVLITFWTLTSTAPKRPHSPGMDFSRLSVYIRYCIVSVLHSLLARRPKRPGNVDGSANQLNGGASWQSDPYRR